VGSIQKAKLFFIAFSLTATLGSIKAGTSCGTDGSVAQRIQQCKETCDFETSNRQFISWHLVARTSWGKEVWYDPINQKIWSDQSSYRYTFENSKNICETGAIGREQTAYIHGYWKLPRQWEYRKASNFGLLSCLPGLQLTDLWVKGFSDTDRIVFNGSTGRFSTIPQRSFSQYYIRCAMDVRL
jgi:hypothetical protein